MGVQIVKWDVRVLYPLGVVDAKQDDSHIESQKEDVPK